MDSSGLSDINPYILFCGHVTRQTCPSAGTPYEERMVKWHELELILWGEGYIMTNGKKIPTVKGNLLFRKPGMTVQGFSPYYCYLIVFDMFYDGGKKEAYSNPEYFNLIRDRSLDPSPFLPPAQNPLDLPDAMEVQHYSKYETLFSSIHHQFISDRSSQFFLKAYLMEVLMLAYSEWLKVKVLHHSSRSIRNNYPKIMQIKEYIDNHIESNIKLKELAGIVNLSPNFLCKLFKDTLGINLIEYVNSSRINMAKTALLNTNKAVKEISFECGFENDCYFYTLFKKLEGISPSQYREKYRLML